jgi:hypothetical protein
MSEFSDAGPRDVAIERTAQVADGELGRPDGTDEAESANSTDRSGSVPTVDRDLFRRLQALEDAIVLRRARVGGYCQDCEQSRDGRCDNHACDLHLSPGTSRTLER